MPTVIDELVVTLNLDSSKFNDEQKKLVQQLGSFEQASRRAAERAERATNDNVVGFFRSIGAPYAAVKRHFEDLARTVSPTGATRRNLTDLATQGRRSGQAVQAGALEGAAGLRALGVAGLAAFVSIEALDKVMRGAGESARKVFPTGIASGAAGLSPDVTSTISTALNLHGNVPRSETENLLANLRQLQNKVKNFGVTPGSPEFIAAAAAGIDLLSDSQETVLRKFAHYAQGVSSDQAVTQGTALGMTQQQALALRSAGDNFDQYLKEASKYAVNQNDVNHSNAYIEAQNKLWASLDRVTRTIYDELDPGLVKLYGVLTSISDAVNNTLENLGGLFGMLKAYAIGGLPGLAYHIWQGAGSGGGGNPGPGAMRLPGGGVEAPIGGAAGTSVGGGDWTTGPTGNAGVAAPNDAYFNWGSVGGGPATARHYNSAEEGVQAVGTLLRSGLYRGLTLRQMAQKYAPDGQQDVLVSRLSQWMGMSPDTVPNVSDPETLRRLTTSFIANEHGGALPRDLNQSTIDRAMGGLKTSGGEGAYGVPGAVMNYASSAGGVGAPGTNLVSVSSAGGHTFTVNRASAQAFLGFVNELEARGYDIKSIGGYNMRDKTGGGGLSEHAFGNAIDINPGANPYGSHKTDLPADIHELAAKYGLIWGGDWKSNPDPMHFQWGGPMAGYMANAIRMAQAGAAGSTTHNHGDANLSVTVNTQPGADGPDIAGHVGSEVQNLIKNTMHVTFANEGYAF